MTNKKVKGRESMTNGAGKGLSTLSKHSDRRSRYLIVLAILVPLVAIAVTKYYYGLESFTPLSSKSSSEQSDVRNKDEVILKPSKNETLAEKMVNFLDELVELQVDDFVTIEKTPAKLCDLLRFNNLQILPRLQSIVKMDLFKYVKFNLQRPCHLYTDSFSCTKTTCNIEFCSKSELPESYLEFDAKSCPMDSPSVLSKLDKTMSRDSVEALNDLFECSRDDTDESQYYDLIRNPERYTAYDGRQIWKAIYEENCFLTKASTNNRNSDIFSLNKTCYEERLFYRSLSGLHSSITTHLVTIHLKDNNQFGPSYLEYARRFYSRTDWLKNLFFIYMIELNALYRAEPYLMDRIKWNVVEPEGDRQSTREAIRDLLKSQQHFKWHFDEDILFKNQPKALAEQIASHFHNITFNIMDCVSCDKCRLWGKVQTNGLGTAFKILLTKDVGKLKLSHHEVTCLFNGLARLSFSVSQISNFQKVFKELAEAGDPMTAEEISKVTASVPGAGSGPKIFF